MSTAVNTQVTIEDVIRALSLLHVSGQGDRDQWSKALTAAAGEAVNVLAICGAVSEDDEFYQAVTRVANHGFGLKEAEDVLEIAIGRVGAEQAHAVEYAHWRGAYALGLAVGLRLAAGAR